MSEYKALSHGPVTDAIVYGLDESVKRAKYPMTDTKQIYSNGIVFVPLFRVEQAFVDKAYNGLQEG